MIKSVHNPSDLRFLFLQQRAIQIQLSDWYHFDILKLLLQLRQEHLRVTDDDDIARLGIQPRPCKLLNVSGAHGLHVVDVSIDLIKPKTIQRQRSHLPDETIRRLEVSRKVSNHDSLAWRQLNIRRRRGR